MYTIKQQTTSNEASWEGGVVIFPRIKNTRIVVVLSLLGDYNFFVLIAYFGGHCVFNLVDHPVTNYLI